MNVMIDENTLPQGWTRNRGIEARLVRDVCVQHDSLSLFVDIASPQCTEGTYDCPPSAMALVKGYRQHDSFNGFTCCVQVPLFDREEADQVVAEVLTVLEEHAESEC
jgi:hypothetical protein